MVDKILKIFFIKKQTEKKEDIKNRKIKIISLNKTRETKKNHKEIKTCLSGYFIGHRGLNMIERGHTYL